MAEIRVRSTNERISGEQNVRAFLGQTRCLVRTLGRFQASGLTS